jgi:hypothetical protein
MDCTCREPDGAWTRESAGIRARKPEIMLYRMYRCIIVEGSVVTGFDEDLHDAGGAERNAMHACSERAST